MNILLVLLLQYRVLVLLFTSGQVLPVPLNLTQHLWRDPNMTLEGASEDLYQDLNEIKSNPKT